MNPCKILLCVSLVGSLAACVSQPRETIHTLIPLHASPPTSGVQVVAPVRVRLSSLSLPDLLDQASWVVRVDHEQLQILEQQRWPQPLSSEIAQAVVDNLNEALASMTKGKAPLRAELASVTSALGTPPAAVQLQVRVQRFDTILSPSAGIDDQFAWTLTCADTAQSPARAINAHYATGWPALPPASSDTSSLDVYDQLTLSHMAALQAAAQSMAQSIMVMATQCAAP